MTAHDELFPQPIYDFTASRYAVGRALLMGDAATVARPHTGAGAVKALQDATVLEPALTSTATRPQALAAYDADRAPYGRVMVDLERRLGRALVQQTPNWRERGGSAPLEAAVEGHAASSAGDEVNCHGRETEGTAAERTRTRSHELRLRTDEPGPVDRGPHAPR
ncbi:FAD-dependent monooxygenase [Streptomyces sp. UG1]|uniref:FAD-dependent monooxygenase n=1 Tax=Streptomyces sp. UG1 TaxID=3417652 RepID=UPI003CF45017